MTVLLRPGSNEVILDANFGLVYQSPQGGWLYTCDDIFGGRIPYRSQIAADGRVFVPAMDGLSFGRDGCGWTKSTGALVGQNVYDVAFDPAVPERIWAVGGDPRTVALSTDGGNTFVARHSFPEHLRFIRVAVAPSDPKVIYLAGFNGTQVPLVMAVSTDGGETWALDEKASVGIATSNQIVEFLGVSPDDPQTVYVMVTSGKGDEIWKSTEQGRALVKVLTLADQEEWPRGGFSFGATGQILYVAGYDPLNTGTRPPASLYISRDAGATWLRRPSADTGPRYRCIAHRAGQLYGCGGGQISGDQFLLGVSSDEGQSWTPVVATTDVRGPHDCIADKCRGTVDFLRSFEDGGVPLVDAAAPPDAPAPPDTAALPEPPRALAKSGCSFAATSRGPTQDSRPAAFALLVASLVSVLRRPRPRA